MLGVVRHMWSTLVSVVVSTAPFVKPSLAFKSNDACPAGVHSPSSQYSDRAAGFASEHVLLQRMPSKIPNQSDSSKGPDSLVKDENGFQADEDIDDIVADTSCSGTHVRRRRRDDAMCVCRRRSSGKRYDGGWACQDDEMVQEPPQFTNPMWSEEFDDERGNGSLNESRWVLTYSGSGNGNNEEQFYTTRSDNLHIQDGVLKIVGKIETFEGKGYTSGKITTKHKGDFGPGMRIEVRAKLPLGVGTWPAIWMMPTDSNYGGWPGSGEIDIMEAVGKSHGKVFGTIHTGAYNHMRGTHKGKSFYTDFSEWHTYALNWEEDKLTWYADGNLYNTFAPDNINDYAKWPFNRRFYLILNLAIGGNLGGDISFWNDQVMEIDYVRIFCLDGSTNCKQDQITCCDKCPRQKYCSPISGNCYSEKRKDYYDSCQASGACLTDEELYFGVCYKKCSLLTNGTFNHRAAAATCCKEEGFECWDWTNASFDVGGGAGDNDKATPGRFHVPLKNLTDKQGPQPQLPARKAPGEGYDVKGKDGWPHAIGACLTDEEMFLGVCYKKCSLLTNGTFNHRAAAATCCKEEGIECWDWTNASFVVGGDAGDNDKATPGRFHVPLKNLTEKKGPQTQLPRIPKITKSEMAPDDHRHDNHVCKDDEELYRKLCYKKCSILTDGQYPIRGTAFSCCKEEPCGINNQQQEGIVPCQGYDVSGNGGCPHKIETCLLDEEVFLGLCYKKCSILSNGAYSLRSSPTSCCKDDGLGCYNPFGNVAESSDALGVGGGRKDHNLATPGYAHPPIGTLTDAAV